MWLSEELTLKETKITISEMKNEKLLTVVSNYIAPCAIELPMEAEECIATSNPSPYGPGGNWGDDDFDDDDN